jgi:hypothetical protein
MKHYSFNVLKMDSLIIFDKQIISQYLTTDTRVIVRKVNSDWRKINDCVRVKNIDIPIPFKMIDMHVMLTDDLKQIFKFGVSICSLKIIQITHEKYKKMSRDPDFDDNEDYELFDEKMWEHIGKFGTVRIMKNILELNGLTYSRKLKDIVPLHASRFTREQIKVLKPLGRVYTPELNIAHIFIGAVSTNNTQIIKYLVKNAKRTIIHHIDHIMFDDDDDKIRLALKYIMEYGNIKKKTLLKYMDKNKHMVIIRQYVESDVQHILDSI